jgi:hypothetical protein
VRCPACGAERVWRPRVSRAADTMVESPALTAARDTALLRAPMQVRIAPPKGRAPDPSGEQGPSTRAGERLSIVFESPE